MNEKRKNKYRAGIYCRISVKEEQCFAEEQADGSIRSQIRMAEDYIGGQDGILLSRVYADEGVSGSGFDRKNFRKMLSDIEAGIIDMVIVKDISRLGRDHIGTAYYLERYFPEKQIRVVSLLDHYDSAAGTYDELLQIRSLLNDMYLRDISGKISSAVRAKKNAGEYISGEAPFGYVKSRTRRGRLETDEAAAEIVRKIYRMYIGGMGCTAISRVLNDGQIPSPARYKKEVLENISERKTGRGIWTPSAVRDILSNPVYAGAAAERKSRRLSYKIPRRKRIPVSEQRIVPCSHDAVISAEEFRQVQQIRKERYSACFERNEKSRSRIAAAFGGEVSAPAAPRMQGKTVSDESGSERKKVEMTMKKRAYEQFMEGTLSEESYAALKQNYENKSRRPAVRKDGGI